MKQEIKVFVITTTLKDCFLKCIKEGFIPATTKQIVVLAKKGLIEKDKGYDTRTFYFPETGEFKDVNTKEIKKIIKKHISVRPMYVGNLDSRPVAYGSFSLDYPSGRLVGIKKKKASS